MGERPEKLVYAADFTRRMNWTNPTTVYRKLSRSRKKTRDGEPLTRNDMPLPDIVKPGELQWYSSTLEKYVERYRRPGAQVENPQGSTPSDSPPESAREQGP